MSGFFSRQFLRDFIHLYESFPALWQISCDEYKNKDLRMTAYKMLLSKLKQVEPEANIETVKKRICNLRTVYRRELKKMRLGEKKRIVYTPTLCYFKDLDFLRNVETHLRRGSNFNIEDEECLEENLSPPSKKKKTREDKMSTYEEDEPIQLAVTKLQENATDNDPLAKSWAMQYNEMNSRQKTLARKIISDVLFHGCMGNLEMSHAMKIQSIFLQPAVRPNMEETTDSFEVTYLTDMKSPIDY
ncbi:uncharacterized protein LOC119682614 isoform X2 [Teleopsis dalmanni]|uniref:uncharacterized protein LOC119682614 isoform X2 n=1 Tax=Teleopsis dalmanni TaxID=139649 RepID=UPI000D32C0A9|nr:uncharacterized protein LOC119682614 isoform X2 [Teleopsis dalmanni]